MRSLSIPRFERLQDLQTFAVGINRDLNVHAILRRRLEGILSRVISTGRKLVSRRVREFEGLAIGTNESVSKGVEGKGSTERHSGDDVGGGDKGMGGRVGIIASSEVTVIRCDDY
jgi:hypothetical protein